MTYLPNELQDLKIQPNHKVLLTHRRINNDIWVVLLTNMPGQSDKAWKLHVNDYYNINSLHESYDRWVRNRLKPTFEICNVIHDQPSLFNIHTV